MKTIALLASVLMGLFVSSASANFYPIAPPHSLVSLDPSEFIYAVPQQTEGLVTPSPIIGDDVGQHPGAWQAADPSYGVTGPDLYLVGLFARPIDTSNANAAVYLWRTFGNLGSGYSGSVGGPQIEVGYWDGSTFTRYGRPQFASYRDTGVGGDAYIHPYPCEFLCFEIHELASSMTLLSDFDIPLGFPTLLNSVRIEAANFYDRQYWAGSDWRVTGIAANLVPEPETLSLLAVALIALSGCRRRSSVSTGVC